MKPKENLLRVIKHDGPQWVPNGLESVMWLMPPVVERPVMQSGYDSFGVHWSYNDNPIEGAYPTANGHPIKSIHRWRKEIKLPDVEAMDWNQVRKNYDLFKSVNDIEDWLVMGYIEFCLFERSWLLLGMEEALVAYLAEKELMKELLGAIADYKIALITKFQEIVPLEMVWLGDDWGTQQSLFLSPEVWREMIKPELQRIYDCIKERGIIINQHSCGNIELIFQDLVEMGMIVWNPCQPCNDLVKMKKRFGDRVCFQGGIDSQFVLNRPGVTDDELRVEVRRRISDLAPGGGYIAEPSHTVSYDEHVLSVMNDEIRAFGGAFYRKQ